MPNVPQSANFKDCKPISLMYYLGKLAKEAAINRVKTHLQSIKKPGQFAHKPKIGTPDSLLKLIVD